MLKFVFIQFSILGYLFSSSHAETITWTGAVNTSWENAGNWDKGKLPTEVDDVVIFNKEVAPVLDMDRSVLSLYLRNSKLVLGANTLTISKASDITRSTVTGGTLNFTGDNCKFESSTISSKCVSLVNQAVINRSVFEEDIDLTAGSFSYNINTFKGLVALTKTGSVGDQDNGGNTYEKNTVITNKGTGFLTLAYQTGGDKYNADVTFNTEGTCHIGVSVFSYNNIYNGATIFNAKNGGIGFCGGVGTATFNGEVYINAIGGNVFCGGYGGSLATFNGNIHMNTIDKAIMIGGYAGNGNSILKEGKTIILNENRGDFAGKIVVADMALEASSEPISFTYSKAKEFSFLRCSFARPLTLNTNGFNFLDCIFDLDVSINTKEG